MTTELQPTLIDVLPVERVPVKFGPREIYKDAAGKRVPSVTTILSRFKESGGLLHWANQAGLDGLTLEDARAVAATAGTMAHALVEAAINHRPDPDLLGDADTIRRARAAFDTYRKWADAYHITMRHTEVSLVSQLHRFGGRLDAIGLEGDTLVLLDWKTSNAVYPDMLLQLAGYKLLWEENFPDHRLHGFHLCRFAKEQGDFCHHYFPSIDAEAETFLVMRELYDKVKQVEKRVK